MYIKRFAYLMAAMFINLLLLSMISVVGDTKRTPETKKYEVMTASFFHLKRAKELQQKSKVVEHELVNKQDKSVVETLSVKIEKAFDNRRNRQGNKSTETIARNDSKPVLTKGSNLTKLGAENISIKNVNNPDKLTGSIIEENKQESMQLSQIDNSNSQSSRNTSVSRGDSNVQTENSSADSKDKFRDKNIDVSNENKNMVQTEPETIDNPADVGIETKEIKRVQPAYPQLAAKAGIQAVVIVKVLIGIDGRVEKIEFVKSAAKLGFDDAVREALKEWQFEPMTYKGRPVKVWSGKIPFKFSLK